MRRLARRSSVAIWFISLSAVGLVVCLASNVVPAVATAVVYHYDLGATSTTSAANVGPATAGGESTVSVSPGAVLVALRAVSATEEPITIDEGSAGRIFRDSQGHLVEDTPANRSLLTDTANNASNLLGTDEWGNDWYASSQEDGSQVWTRVRNGKITNGGVNAPPWNSFGPGGLRP